MSDGASPPPAPLPESLRRFVTPWWRARADRLGTLLEGALAGGQRTVKFDGRYITVEHLTEMALQAVEMVEDLDGRTGGPA